MLCNRKYTDFHVYLCIVTVFSESIVIDNAFILFVMNYFVDNPYIDYHCYCMLMCEGVEKMATHVEAMTGYRVHKIWKICWKIISPTLIIVSINSLAESDSNLLLLCN